MIVASRRSYTVSLGLHSPSRLASQPTVVTLGQGRAHGIVIIAGDGLSTRMWCGGCCHDWGPHVVTHQRHGATKKELTPLGHSGSGLAWLAGLAICSK